MDGDEAETPPLRAVLRVPSSRLLVQELKQPGLIEPLSGAGRPPQSLFADRQASLLLPLAARRKIHTVAQDAKDSQAALGRWAGVRGIWQAGGWQRGQPQLRAQRAALVGIHCADAPPKSPMTGPKAAKQLLVVPCSRVSVSPCTQVQHCSDICPPDKVRKHPERTTTLRT